MFPGNTINEVVFKDFPIIFYKDINRIFTRCLGK